MNDYFPLSIKELLLFSIGYSLFLMLLGNIMVIIIEYIKQFNDYIEKNRVGGNKSPSHTTVRAVRHTAVQFK